MLRDYRGIPFLERGRSRDGVDCLGHLVVAFRGDWGIEIESHVGPVSALEREEAEALCRGEISAGRWRPIKLGEEREWDVAWFREPGRRTGTHVGIVITPPWLQHAHETSDLVVPDRYDVGPWSKMLLGFQRNVELEKRHEA